MQIFLELSGHPKANIKRVALAGRTVIGRSQACGLQIASPSVSRKHCEIRFDGETASIVDLGSSNGTFLGSQRITPGEEHPLSEGIRLNIGGIRFLVSYLHPAEKADKGSVPSKEADERTVAFAATGTAAAAAVATGISDDDEPLPLDDDEPLPLDDDDDFLGLTATTDEPEASLSVEKVDEDDAPLVAQDDSVILDDFEEAAEESEGDDWLPADDVALVAEPSEKESPAAASEQANEDEGLQAKTSPGEVDSEEEDDDILPVNDPSDILLSDDESLDLLSDEIITDSASLQDDLDSSDEEAGADEVKRINDEGEEVRDEFTEESDEQTDEPVLGLEDEDQAFAFLDDDEDNSSNSESPSSDAELSDFLSGLGRN